MGEIVGAAVVSHVPPIVMPEDVRRELNNGEETSLVPGLHRLGVDTFVVFDTRWFTLVEMVVTSHGRRTGNYT